MFCTTYLLFYTTPPHSTSVFQQLHLLELIRENKIEEALHFAQEQLSESGQSDPDILNELERTMALLAFGEPMNSPFGDLLNQAHRQKVGTHSFQQAT